MSFEITGKLYEKFDTLAVSDKFRKREFVLEKTEAVASGEYTEHIKFQLTQDKCDLLDRHNLKDQIKVSFNIRGRRWEKDGKVNYFTNLEAWRIERVGDEQASKPVPGIDYPDFETNTTDSDLPF